MLQSFDTRLQFPRLPALFVWVFFFLKIAGFGNISQFVFDEEQKQEDSFVIGNLLKPAVVGEDEK